MKRRHEISACVDRLIVTILAFIWLCLALKKRWIPIQLYVPLLIIDIFVWLAAACKLYNLWETR